VLIRTANCLGKTTECEECSKKECTRDELSCRHAFGIAVEGITFSVNCLLSSGAMGDFVPSDA
jgi:hypothetical protein